MSRLPSALPSRIDELLERVLLQDVKKQEKVALEVILCEPQGPRSEAP